MSRKRKIGLALLIVLAGIQFIHPALNKSSQQLPTDISKIISIPDSVQVVLSNACYDCHSNNTHYPWYSYIQPISWILNKHINQGKKELNFSEFDRYSSRMQLSKLTEIGNSIKDNQMPLRSYKWMHKKARLTKYEQVLIINWVKDWLMKQKGRTPA